MAEDVSNEFWGRAQLHLSAGMRVSKDMGPEERRQDTGVLRVRVQDMSDGD